MSQSPYGEASRATQSIHDVRRRLEHMGSQSPYGEASRATFSLLDTELTKTQLAVAIPLRGSISCNNKNLVVLYSHLMDMVAIPLRGSISCNSTPQRTSSWTSVPEGGFVRKMKLGIYTRRIEAFSRGLGPSSSPRGRCDENPNAHTRVLDGVGLSRSPAGTPALGPCYQRWTWYVKGRRMGLNTWLPSFLEKAFLQHKFWRQSFCLFK